MNHRVALITDTTCDVPPDLLEQYAIAMAPLSVIFGDQVLRDHIDVTPRDFYRMLNENPHHPSTTQPTPAVYADLYEQAFSAGAEEIVVIAISEAMSGSMQSSRQAAAEFTRPIHLRDSRSVSMGLGWQVLAAARAREAGGAAPEMLEAAEAVRRSSVLHVCLNTLEFLHRGGRIGSAAAMVGTVLRLKPLIAVNCDEGKVEPLGRVRTRAKSIAALYDRFFETLDTSKPMRVAVMHGDAPEEAEALVQRVRSEQHPVEMFTVLTGPVLGVHTGPGTLALAGYTEG